MTSSEPKDSNLPSGIERRKAKRRKILDTFSVFIVIPKKGLHRLTVHDISEEGMGFDLDIEGEPTTDFPVKVSDSIDFRFYLNHSLFMPLSVQVVRVSEQQSGRRVGAEFQAKKAPGYKAFIALLQLLDSMIEVLNIDPSS